MNGNKALLATNIIVFASKQLIDINTLLKEYDEICVSIITLMEVYGYNFKSAKEKELVDELFENFRNSKH